MIPDEHGHCRGDSCTAGAPASSLAGPQGCCAACGEVASRRSPGSGPLPLSGSANLPRQRLTVVVGCSSRRAGNDSGGCCLSGFGIGGVGRYWIELRPGTPPTGPGAGRRGRDTGVPRAPSRDADKVGSGAAAGLASGGACRYGVTWLVVISVRHGPGGTVDDVDEPPIDPIILPVDVAEPEAPVDGEADIHSCRVELGVLRTFIVGPEHVLGVVVLTRPGVLDLRVTGPVALGNRDPPGFHVGEGRIAARPAYPGSLALNHPGFARDSTSWEGWGLAGAGSRADHRRARIPAIAVVDSDLVVPENGRHIGFGGMNKRRHPAEG